MSCLEAIKFCFNILPYVLYVIYYGFKRLGAFARDRIMRKYFDYFRELMLMRYCTTHLEFLLAVRKYELRDCYRIMNFMRFKEVDILKELIDKRKSDANFLEEEAKYYHVFLKR